MENCDEKQNMETDKENFNCSCSCGNCTGGKYSAGNRFGICISVRAEPESGAELFLDRQREGNGRTGYPDHGIKGLDNGKKDFGRQ